MKVLIFLTAFLFSLLESLYYSIPMAIDTASVCLKADKFRWNIDDMEFLDLLDKELSGEE